MKILLALSLAAGSLALPQQAQQLTFAPSAPILSPALLGRLASLPTSHSQQLLQHIQALPEQRWVQFEEGGERVAVTEGEKALLVFERRPFRDVTDDADEFVSVQKQETYPKKLSYSAAELKPLFRHISIKQMSNFLTSFTAFYTRYYRSPTGRDSQLFLLNHVKELRNTLNKKVNLTITEFEHSWGQNTIIARFEPTNSTGDEPIVIMGAHQDSTNSLPFLRAPGADDDGSGTTVLLTVLRSLLAEKYSAQNGTALEFHFYSAEEGGMLGSGEVSRKYLSEGKKVRAMFHMDVVAFVKPGTKPTIGLLNDNSDEGLVDFMRKLITEYATIGYTDTTCGYACSDHTSWNKVGLPATCLSEGKYEDSNTRMHSTGDTMDQPEYSLDHMSEFARIGLGYAVELAGMKK